MSEAEPDPQALLRDWRREGLWRADPVRFFFLEGLARRLAGQPPAVRARLENRLQAGVVDYAERLAQAREAIAQQASALAVRRPALARQLRALQALGDVRGLQRLTAQAGLPEGHDALVRLTRHVDELSPTLQAAQAGVVAGREELASVRRFRSAWARSRSQDRLAHAGLRRPSNAGPLNSHALVLQTLELLQQLSPEHLRHVLVQVESLQWLEELRDAPAPAAPRRSRARS